MRKELIIPSGTIFLNGKNLYCCDLISYNDFIHEINYINKKGKYTYYEGRNKIYESEVD